jgi:multidrug efflux pump subunit AcrA (membrane-fusion protein)
MMRRLAWAAVGVVVLGGAAFTAVAGAESAPRYRLAVATTGDVQQTITVSGTVDRVNRADVSFGTSGKVATLSASVGDAVSAGQTLGSLETASLQAAVDRAASDVSGAESRLSEAESAVSEPAGPSAGALVQEVKDAQTAASGALKAAADAVAAQAAACADPTAPACAAAGGATLTAQHAVSSAQETLQGKLNALSAALASTQSSPPSAGSVAEAQASVDQAKVKLVEAQQALAGAVLTSPITGTVASVAVAVGGQAGPDTPALVVVGEGAIDVAATVPVEELDKLAVGQEATVTPVGTSERIAGQVTRVGTLPDPAAETIAYPVTITVDSPPASLATGSSATASVVVATAKDVLTVPTSAITRSAVTVLTGDQPTLTRVTTGAVGPSRTEIKEGLQAGDQVVLADLDAPLPTGDDSPGAGGFVGGGPQSGPVGGGPDGNVHIRPGK